VLPRLVASGVRVAAYNTPEYIRDVGTPARHAVADANIAADEVASLNIRNKRPAIFFDCDGVLNEEPGNPGVISPDGVVPIPGAGCAVSAARAAGFLTVAVTNRGQVARGIGDSLRDVGAARAMRLSTYDVRTGYGCRDADRYPSGPDTLPVPDLMFEDVVEAVDFCISFRTLAMPITDAMRNHKKSGSTPFIIAIGGRSRAGKSVIAHALLRTLSEEGYDCLRVRLDDWIVPAADRPTNSDGETRHRVDAMPEVVRGLRAGKTVIAPGYDPATRGCGSAVTYDPTGKAVVILEGSFALHARLRSIIDLAAFVENPAEIQRARFATFYRWKGFDDTAVEELWRRRLGEEWPAVDAQRQHADLILTSTGKP
jgi:uridine kinase